MAWIKFQPHRGPVVRVNTAQIYLYTAVSADQKPQLADAPFEVLIQPSGIEEPDIYCFKTSEARDAVVRALDAATGPKAVV